MPKTRTLGLMANKFPEWAQTELGQKVINKHDIADMAPEATAPTTPDIQKTLDERGARYGSFFDHANIAQYMKTAWWSYPGWQNLKNDQRQALEVIADKIARILNGDPNYVDNWHDIQGYAKLVEDRLNGN